MSETPLVCPRREEIPPGPFKILEGEDSWREGRTCSFCGSLDPDLVLARIKAGTVKLIPTDKSYKLYLQNEGGEPFVQSYRDCPQGSAPHLPEDCPHWTTRKVTQTKFYFQHFSKEQMREFVELLNAQRMKFGEPGYFYRLPFFIARD